MNSPIQVSLIRFESTMQEHSYFYGSRAITWFRFCYKIFIFFSGS